MASNFHEDYAREEVAPPSDRATAYVFVAVCAIVAILYRETLSVVLTSAAVGLILLAAALIRPQTLRPLTIAWHRFGLLLHKIMSPIILFVLYAVAIIPVGLLVRLFADPLRLKRQQGTYWIDIDPEEANRGSMKNQF